MTKACMMTFPLERAGITPLLNLVDIMKDVYEEVILIIPIDISNKEYFEQNFEVKGVHVELICHSGGGNFLGRILSYILTEIRLTLKLLRIKKIDFLMFFLGGELLLLPLITAKIYGKTIITFLAGFNEEIKDSNSDFLNNIISGVPQINYAFSSNIVIYSTSLIKKWKLEKYRHKIRIACEHHINLNDFKITHSIDEREDIIGFVGRLSPEKGILNFVRAIKAINGEKNVKFMIIGDGILKNDIINFIDDNHLNEEVELIGWIPHHELSEYLNKFKLLVIPSYTEGLPNILLESMACGTPVLSAPVGIIPDLIKEGVNGFMMKNNSSDSIINGIIKVLNKDNIDVISNNCRQFIEIKFTKETAIRRYLKFLEDFN